MRGRRTMKAYIERDGGAMPVIGLGTWQLEGVLGRRAVRSAIEMGYRHVDTAQMYENEEDVGQAMKESGVEREKLFVTTKLAIGNLNERSVRESCARSLERLITDYVDLLLIHWPDDAVPLEETLGVMVELKRSGQVKHVGVSNFPVDRLESAMKAVDVPIFCNQVEYHPYLDQERILSICRRNGIALTAYCPLARAKAAGDGRLAEIGSRYGKSAAQVALRWLIQQPGVAAIPKASGSAHLRENLDVFDFELTAEEVNLIDSIEKDHRLIDPEWAPTWND
jgi:2,5-diketo-D-gluconate reductase B